MTVTYNAAAHIADFLRCCLAQDHENFELLIIDNASGDSTAAVVEAYQEHRIRFVKNSENIGYAAACNQGVRYFRERGATEILFINNDTEFEANLFRSLSETRRAYGADAITPRIVLASDPRKNWYASGKFVFWKGFQAQMNGENQLDDPTDRTPRLTPAAPGCCVLFSIRVLEDVGEFDEVFFVYYEDTDYCLRMLYAGKSLLYAPDLVLIHKVSVSTGGPVSPFSVRLYNRNQAYILRKHFAPLVVALQIPVLLVKALVRVARGREGWNIFRLRLRSTWEGLHLPLPKDRWRHYRVPRTGVLTEQSEPIVRH